MNMNVEKVYQASFEGVGGVTVFVLNRTMYISSQEICDWELKVSFSIPIANVSASLTMDSSLSIEDAVSIGVSDLLLTVPVAGEQLNEWKEAEF